jgi:spermidine synthase
LLLLLLALPFFRSAPKSVSAGMVALTLLAGWGTHLRQGFANPCEHESNYFCVRVVDASQQAPFGEARALVLDHLVHGINHQTQPDMLITPYVHLMQELVAQHFEDQSALRYFFAGGGSYTQPRAVIAADPSARVTVAELDPMVTDVVQQEMYVNTDDLQIIHGDARTALYRLQDQQFDVVVTDAFHDIAIPYHLVTQEFMQLAKSRLTENGLFVTNVVDAFPDPRMVKSLLKTLQQEFAQVDVWLDRIPQQPQRMTYVISASQQAFPSDLLTARQGFERRWYRINEPLLNSGTPLQALPVFTDDFVPVERMIAGLLLTHEGL